MFQKKWSVQNDFSDNSIKQYKQFLIKLRSNLKHPLTPECLQKVQLHFEEIINYIDKLCILRQQQGMIQKIILYTWQILNVYYIQKKNNVKENDLKKLQQLVKWTYKNNYNESCYKNMLICIFNILKNQKTSFDRQIIKIIIKQGTLKQMKQKQFQWFIYIVQLCNEKISGFVKQICRYINIQNNIKSNFLTFICELLQKIIQQRSTTQIVSGFQCPINDVRQMYNKKQNFKFKLSYQDYVYLLEQLLPYFINKYKQYIIKVINNQNGNIYEQSNFMDIVSICNCISFLGGYNPIIQQKTIQLILKQILFLFQLSFLLYQLSNEKMRKITTDHNLGNYYQNLIKLLNCEIQKKQFNQSQLVHNGQLVSIIRLLSNFVHINKNCQQYFQNNLFYFRMILSLTHQSQTQLTMKNWAIIFIKNASSQSQIMRKQIQKLNISLKVQ